MGKKVYEQKQKYNIEKTKKVKLINDLPIEKIFYNFNDIIAKGKRGQATCTYWGMNITYQCKIYYKNNFVGDLYNFTTDNNKLRRKEFAKRIYKIINKDKIEKVLDWGHREDFINNIPKDMVLKYSKILEDIYNSNKLANDEITKIKNKI